MLHELSYGRQSRRPFHLRFRIRHAAIGLLVTCLHYAGSVNFYNSPRYYSWRFGYSSTAPNPSDARLTREVLIYEFPGFQLFEGSSFLTIAAASAFVWGSGASAIACLGACAMNWVLPEDQPLSG